MVPIITKAGIPYVSATGSQLGRADHAGHVHVDRRVPGRPGRHGQATRPRARLQEGHRLRHRRPVRARPGRRQIGTPAVQGGRRRASPSSRSRTRVGGRHPAGDGRPGRSARRGRDRRRTRPPAPRSCKALSTVDPSLPVYANTSCLNTSTLTALGSAMNGVKIFGRSDTAVRSTPRRALYRYVMAKYCPDGQRHRVTR